MARVLVVDDENNIRLMVRLALQASGHAVQTASDGQEALNLFGDGTNCDAVLLDQRMPGMEGLDVLREMRRRDTTARIVMMTAFGTIDLAASAMQAGATGFLRKPFTTSILRGTVQGALENMSVVPESNVQMPLAAPHFERASINGLRIQPLENEGAVHNAAGIIEYSFGVCGVDNAAVARCTVVLPQYVVELVRAHADCEEMPEPLFWRWLCEESLANYLWQNAEAPTGGTLRVDELTTGMRRWMDAVLTI